MAYYLVRAKALRHKLAVLQARLESGEIRSMQPFGRALDYSLKNAWVEGEWLVWEEEDYCRPPLAMERAAVPDDYFADLAVERVEKGEGWKRLEELPRLWEAR
jgi:hypothetical protein